MGTVAEGKLPTAEAKLTALISVKAGRSDQLDAAKNASDDSSGDKTCTDKTQIDNDAHSSNCKTAPLDQTQGLTSSDKP